MNGSLVVTITDYSLVVQLIKEKKTIVLRVTKLLQNDPDAHATLLTSGQFSPDF